jgi:hypothetical protein
MVRRLELNVVLIILALIAAACSPLKPPVESSPPSGERFTYNGVSFDLDPAVSASVNGQIVPENPGSEDGPFWEVHPQYVQISLDGYPLEQTFFSPVIAVYPVEEYSQMSPRAGETLDNLKDFLVQKPAAADQAPFLPVINYGQVFHSNLEGLDFQNGSGARFLAIYAQEPAPVNNQALIYTFQGLTSDGRYVVSVILPVNHPSLPADANALSISELKSIAENYDTHRAEMASLLSSQPADSFTPDLDKLDTLVASLAIER